MSPLPTHRCQVGIIPCVTECTTENIFSTTWEYLMIPTSTHLIKKAGYKTEYKTWSQLCNSPQTCLHTPTNLHTHIWMEKNSGRKCLKKAIFIRVTDFLFSTFTFLFSTFLQITILRAYIYSLKKKNQDTIFPVLHHFQISKHSLSTY